MQPKPALRLASRASRLALAQTGMVAEMLGQHGHACDVVEITTRGDEIQDRSLADIDDGDGGAGKGLFIKALEAALLAGQADIAVHSAKDMETALAPGTRIAAMLPRGDRRCALISPHADSIAALPQGARVGTASVRRRAILLHMRPDLHIALLRGNVTTRIAQLEAGKYDAIILAMAGPERLGIGEHVHPLAWDTFPSAPAQGAIAMQIREDDGEKDEAIAATLAAINDTATMQEVTAERALVAALAGSCHTPIAASAHCRNGNLTMEAALYSPDGAACFTAKGSSAAGDAETLGREAGAELLAKAGGRGFMARIDTIAADMQWK